MVNINKDGVGFSFCRACLLNKTGRPAYLTPIILLQCFTIRLRAFLLLVSEPTDHRKTTNKKAPLTPTLKHFILILIQMKHLGPLQFKCLLYTVKRKESVITTASDQLKNRKKMCEHFENLLPVDEDTFYSHTVVYSVII